jgi:hypothetical protein
MDNQNNQPGGPSELAKTFNEKIIFAAPYGEKYSPLEWLQFIASELERMADFLDWNDSNYIKGQILEEKRAEPKKKKINIYEELVQYISESILRDYVCIPFDIINNIEQNQESIVKAAFVNSAIYPILLKAVGIVETVRVIAEMYEYLFWEQLFFCCCSNVEEVKEWFGNKRTDLTGHYFSTPDAVARFNKNPKLKISNYENAFAYLTSLFKEVEKRQLSAELRESIFALRGYCKFNDKDYSETQRKITERLEEMIVLTEKQKKILTYLKNKNIAVAQVDIEVGVDLSNKTVADELRILKKYQLVEHPEGKKYRIGITPKGVEKLNSLK